MIGNGPARPLWIIARQDNGRMDVLTTFHGKNGEALPVFGFEEEAEMFLRLKTPGACWRANETTPGELVSLLYGPCAGVKSVVLDPLPVVGGGIFADLTGRDRFVRNLLGGHGSRKKPVLKISDSTDPCILLEEDGARDAKKDRAEEARRGTLETGGEAPDGKNGTHIPDYTVLDLDHLDEPRSFSEAARNEKLYRT